MTHPHPPRRPRHHPLPARDATPSAPTGSRAIAGLLTATPISALPFAERHFVMLLRQSLVGGGSQDERTAKLTRALGSGFAALRLRLLMECVGAAWPDRFLLRRPCCRVLTPDEALLATMVGAARHQDRPAFDAACRELIGADARALIWNAARAFVQSAAP